MGHCIQEGDSFIVWRGTRFHRQGTIGALFISEQKSMVILVQQKKNHHL